MLKLVIKEGTQRSGGDFFINFTPQKSISFEYTFSLTGTNGIQDSHR